MTLLYACTSYLLMEITYVEHIGSPDNLNPGTARMLAAERSDLLHSNDTPAADNYKMLT